MELYKKYRPKKLERIVGQATAVKVLESKLSKKKIPHTFLFSGPSGCGKTTLARILRKKLECGKHDFVERNCRKIEEIREIRHQINQAPISGKTRIWLIDEAHQLTSDAQNEFLKMLEDTPKHVYFMLATTEPQKLKRTIRTRCTEIVVRSLSENDILQVVSFVCKKENMILPKAVLKKITESCDGSARKALVLLDKIFELEEEEDMIEAIKATTAEVQGIAIARALHNPNTKWKTMAGLLKEVLKEEPETIRWIVLGYARTCLLSGSKISSRAFTIIEIFSDNFYDSKHAGLAAACYEVITGE